VPADWGFDDSERAAVVRFLRRRIDAVVALIGGDVDDAT
jgi:hypothetical protein